MSRRNTSSRLERRTSDVVGCRPEVGHALEHRLAVVRVQQHPVGEHLDPLHQTGHPHRGLRVALRPEPQLDHLPRRVLPDQRRRAALGHDLALVDDHDPVAQLLGLVHVVRGEHQGGAALLEPEQPVPEHVPRLRVEAGRRLVEHEDARLVDQRAGDGQPPLHAARQVVDLGVALLLELREAQELVGPRRAHGPGDAEVAAVHDEVVPHAQLGVEVVLLRHHPEQRPDLRAVRVGVEAEDRQVTGRALRDRADHPHGRGLARAVGPEQPERLARAGPRSRCRRRR